MCSIPISIVVRTTCWAIPFTNTEVFHLEILITAIRTNLTGRKESVYLNDSSADSLAYISKDLWYNFQYLLSTLFEVRLHPTFEYVGFRPEDFVRMPCRCTANQFFPPWRHFCWYWYPCYLLLAADRSRKYIHSIYFSCTVRIDLGIYIVYT